MKRFMVILMVFAALAAAGETKIKEGKSVKLECAAESLFIYRNANFYDRETIYPVKGNSYSYKISKDDTVIALSTAEDSLLEIYSVERKGKTGHSLVLGDVYAYFRENSKAIENYAKAFKESGGYEPYEKMMDIYALAYPDSVDAVMEKYSAQNPKNVGVMYKNSSILKSEGKEYAGIVKEILSMKEKSIPYFNSVLTAIYELDGVDDSLLDDAVKYSVDSFYDMSDFIYIIYHVTDRYAGEKEDTLLSKKLEGLLFKPVSDEALFYIASYLTEQNRSVRDAVSALKSLTERDIYSEYGEYVLYSIAKAYLSAGENDSAAVYVKKAKDEFNPSDYDFFRLMFDAGSADNDTALAIDGGYELLTYDRNDKDVMGKMKSLSKLTEKEIQKQVDKYLEDESMKQKFEDFTLTDLKNAEHKLSKYKGKVILIDFFATRCGPCKMEIKDLIAMKKDYAKEKGIAFVAVSSEDDSELISSFAKERSFDFDIYYNGGALMDRESIKGVPTLYLIDRKGNLCYTRVGYAKENDMYLKTRIDYLLKK